MKLIWKNERGYQLDRYGDYLKEHAGRFPRGAREFALADWHYDFKHHQCPHDSWLETFAIRENASGERSQRSVVEIDSLFFGAYHDLYFSLTYRNVLAYAIECDVRAPEGRRFHGDWIVDELTLTESNSVHHEIQFEFATLIVTCLDLEYRCIPKISRPAH